MNIFKIVTFVAAVFGLYEFIDWYSGHYGLLGGFIYQNLGIEFFLLQNPLTSLYLILPFAWSEPVRTEIREGILARSPLMFHEWIPKLFWFLQGLGYFTLIYQVRYIFGGLSQGYELNSDNFGSTFLSILILVFLIQFILRNLPEIKTL
jgi:hypothetical protein